MARDRIAPMMVLFFVLGGVVLCAMYADAAASSRSKGSASRSSASSSSSRSSSSSSSKSSSKKADKEEKVDTSVKLELRSPFDVSPMHGRLLKEWDIQGSASITSDETGRDILLLAQAQKAQAGLVVSDPVDSVVGFTARFDFRLVPASKSKHPADGMAFWVLSKEPKIGSVLGMSEEFVGLGVIIDSFSNSKRFKQAAYAYAVKGDGAFKYEDMRDGADTELVSGCELEPLDWEKISISYAEGKLRMTVGSRRAGTKYTCFEVDVDMPTAKGALMNDGPIYFAFSAQTGYYFAHHQVQEISIRAFRDSMDAASNARTAGAGAGKPKSLDSHNIYNPDTPIMNEREMEKRDSASKSASSSKNERRSRASGTAAGESDLSIETLMLTLRAQLKSMENSVPEQTFAGLSLVVTSILRVVAATDRRAFAISGILDRAALADAALKEASDLDAMIDKDYTELSSAIKLMAQRIRGYSSTANFLGHYTKRALENSQSRLDLNFQKGRHHLEIGGKSLLVVIFVIVTQGLVIALLVHAKMLDGLDMTSMIRGMLPKKTAKRGRGTAFS